MQLVIWRQMVETHPPLRSDIGSSLVMASTGDGQKTHQVIDSLPPRDGSCMGLAAEFASTGPRLASGWGHDVYRTAIGGGGPRGGRQAFRPPLASRVWARSGDPTRRAAREPWDPQNQFRMHVTRVLVRMPAGRGFVHSEGGHSWLGV